MADELDKDIAAINADLESAKNALVSKDVEEKIAKAKEEAKKEAEKEFLVNQKIKDMETKNQELQKKLEEKEKSSAEELTKLKSKVDELVSSRASVQVKDPFNKPDEIKVDTMSDEKVNQIEEASARAFWGDEAYDDMLRESK